MDINQSQLLVRILDMIEKQNHRMDNAGTASIESRHKSDGHLEALYQVENLILNWGKENESLR